METKLNRLLILEYRVNKDKESNTVGIVSKYRVFSGPYFPLFGLNTGKYGPEKTPHLDTFHAV